MPAVAGALAVLERTRGTVETLGIRAKGVVFAETRAVTRARSGLLRPCVDTYQRASRFMRRARDDVDYAIHCVRAPKRRAGAADDFDSVDVIHEHVLRVVGHTREQRVVDAASIHDDQNLVGEILHFEIAAKTARADLIFLRIDLGDLKIWREAQRLGNARDPGLKDFVVRNHVDGRWRARKRLCLFRHRRYFDIGEVLERHAAQLRDLFRSLGDLGLRGGREPQCNKC